MILMRRRVGRRLRTAVAAHAEHQRAWLQPRRGGRNATACQQERRRARHDVCAQCTEALRSRQATVRRRAELLALLPQRRGLRGQEARAGVLCPQQAAPHAAAPPRRLGPGAAGHAALESRAARERRRQRVAQALRDSLVPLR